jgi:2,4-dienoyl-CoA reductase-like NADH-dependent reductase (Old Yellow Enzyme family)
MNPLLQPFKLGGITLANRIVMAPMTRYFSPSGIPGENVAAYYQRRAEGGIGLIITEGVGVAHPVSTGHPDIPLLHGTSALEGWSKVVQGVHSAGGLIFPQLWHQGPMWEEKLAAPVSGRSPMSPSGTSLDEPRHQARTTAESMSESDIQDVIEAYAVSASNAKQLGFDGIAVHGAHGYLIDSFLWPLTNRRSDRWGGDVAGRAQFGAAVVRGIRQAVGNSMPIMLRLSQFKLQDYRARNVDSPQELEKMLAPFADAGVDIFDGSQRYFDTPIFEGSNLNLAGWAKKLTDKPAMTVGGIGFGKSAGQAKAIDDRQQAANNLPRLVERLAREEFDLVAVGRAVLNDPQWANKVRVGEAFLPFDPENLHRLT